ncbi:MAG: tRNA (adenosine(37)-N6)-threonylcarbamoyltransferase complex dimerization subunit type 1 TsaB [Planctomycetes bacterium]|nr:tRNA (adenosine(37)-N6)-threonylcarbamoyltransferase complex dimerization subunit type 1 TsaB [Planctomycetota bacterium]
MTATLAISGSNLCGEAPFSAALRLDAGTFVANVPAGERGDLTQLCKDLCDANGVAPDGLRRLVVDVGPGSYTGLRVAVTFARFLQQFGALEVEAVDSLAVLAQHAMAGRDGRVRSLLDARRGRLHTAVHELRGGVVVEVEAPNAAAVDEVLARVDGDDFVVAPAAFARELGGSLDGRCRELIGASGLSAAALLADGLPRFAAASADLEPRYLMASYAED